MPVDEVERLKPEARRDRRACGQRQHDAAEHQRQQRTRSSRSTVHHQSAKGVRSTRETMNSPRSRRSIPHSCTRLVDRALTPPDVARYCYQQTEWKRSGRPTFMPRSRPAPSPAAPAPSSRKASPRTSKFRYWSNDAQAGDSSTTGSATPAASASRAASATARSSVPATTCGTWPVELRGKARRRLANQIGLADAREKARQRGDAAGLRLAAGNPEDVAEAGQRLCRRNPHWWPWNR